MSEPGNSEMPTDYKQEQDKEKGVNNIINSAEKIASGPIPLIIEKDVIPPSGDKRDFVSLSPYWYRTEGGELEVRDGKINPEVKNYPDSEKLSEVAINIFITSFAARFTENQDEKDGFSGHAVSTLRAWFVDEETRITPSFEYAQMKQGETTGNFYGIIEGSSLVPVIEGINNLKASGLIDTETLKGAESWFNQYLDWLLTSEKAIGKKDAENEREKKGEKGMPNNHATFYDIQVAYIADFLGKSDLAKETIEGVKERIKSQIKPDGEMPEETKRAIPYDYQLFNLYGFSKLAILGQKYGVDLWNWRTEDGRGLQTAFEYFTGQLKRAGDRPFKMNRSGELFFTLRAASLAYGNENYWDLPGDFYQDPLTEEVTAKMFSQG